MAPIDPAILAYAAALQNGGSPAPAQAAPPPMAPPSNPQTAADWQAYAAQLAANNGQNQQAPVPTPFQGNQNQAPDAHGYRPFGSAPPSGPPVLTKPYQAPAATGADIGTLRDATFDRFLQPGPRVKPNTATDKAYLQTLRDERDAFGRPIDDALKQSQDAVEGFKNQSQALADDSRIGTLLYQQQQQDFAKQRALIAQDTMTERQKIRSQLNDLEAQGVDPNHYYHQLGTAGTILGAIAVGLGAMGAHPLGAHGTASDNAALEIINGAIARDMDAQKSDLQKKLEVMRSRVSMSDTGFNQDLALLKSERESVQTAYEVAQNEITKRMGLYKDNAEMTQNAAKLTAGLKTSQAEYVGKLNEQIYAVSKRIDAANAPGGPAIDRAKIVERARTIRDKAAEGGVSMTPREALLQAAEEQGINMRLPGETPQGYGKLQKGSQQEADKAQQLAAIGNLADQVQGASTSIWTNPIDRVGTHFQGTTGFASANSQQEWNSAVASYMHKSAGVRNVEAMEHLAKPFMIQPNDTPATIALKTQRFKAYIQANPGAAPAANDNPADLDEAK